MAVGAESRIHSLWPLWSWWARWLFPEKIGDEKKRPMCRHISPMKGKSSDFRPAPKKLPGGLNVRISFRGYSIVVGYCSVSAKIQKISLMISLPPLKVVEFPWNLNPLISFVASLCPFWCVSQPFHLQPVPHVGAMQLPTVRFGGTAPCQRRTADLEGHRDGESFSPHGLFGGEKSVRFFLGKPWKMVVFWFFFTCQFERYVIWALRKFGFSFSSRGQTGLKSLWESTIYIVFGPAFFFTDAVSNAPLRVLSDLCVHPQNVLSLQDKNSS